MFILNYAETNAKIQDNTTGPADPQPLREDYPGNAQGTRDFAFDNDMWKDQNATRTSKIQKLEKIMTAHDSACGDLLQFFNPCHASSTITQLYGSHMDGTAVDRFRSMYDYLKKTFATSSRIDALELKKRLVALKDSEMSFSEFFFQNLTPSSFKVEHVNSMQTSIYLHY